MAADQVQVFDNPAEGRYEAQLDGKLAGEAFYELQPGRIVFVHTEVDPTFKGRGIGSLLAKDALDDARSKGLRVVARCPFIARYISEHPEYQDLLA
jgi:predicted GNAT family acetyltransferase